MLVASTGARGRVPPSQSVQVSLPGSDKIETFAKSDATPAFLNDRFGGVVEFLSEKNAQTVVWPARWVLECLPPPAVYIAHLAVTEETASDVLEVNEYRGETIVLIRNVPAIVDEAAMATWLRVGLEDEQPDLVLARKGTDDLEKKLVSINKQIEDLPNAQSESAESAAEELAARRRQAEFLRRLKEATESQLASIKGKLTEIGKSAAEKLAYKLTLSDKTPPFGNYTWEVKFKDTDEGEELSFIASRKPDWQQYWLFMDETGMKKAAGRGKRPIAGAGGMTEVENMSKVRVERVRHGHGMFSAPDASGFYSGQWRHGQYHGVGTQINAGGRFQGHHVDGKRRGKGTSVSAAGDVFRGDWGYDVFHAKPSLINGDEYVIGKPHGRCEGIFVDGARYVGEMRNGMPCGKGRYTRINGDVVEGTFGADGVLEGEGSASADGVTRLGHWRRGLLEGLGTEIDIIVGTYEGDFESSLKHGYGDMKFRLVEGHYVGGYVCGDRGGYGMLDCTPIAEGALEAPPPMPKAAPTAGAASGEKRAKTLYDAGAYRAEGRWRANLIKAGGVVTARNGAHGDPMSYSLGLASETVDDKFPLLYTLMAQEAAVARDRQQRSRAVQKTLRDQRRARERSNALKFARWMRLADLKSAQIAAETRAARGYLDEIAAALEKKKRDAAFAAIGVDEALERGAEEGVDQSKSPVGSPSKAGGAAAADEPAGGAGESAGAEAAPSAPAGDVVRSATEDDVERQLGEEWDD